MKSLLERNPRLASEAAGAQASYESYALERSRLRPQFGLSLRGGEERFANASQNGYGLGDLGGLSLNASQLLFDGGATRSRALESQLLYQASVRSSEELREALALELALAYVDVLKYQSLSHYASENAHAHTVALDKMQRKFRAGAGPRADVDLVTARLSMSEATLESRRRQLNYAITAFRKLTGQEPSELAEPEFPEAHLPLALDEIDLAANPSIEKAQARYEAAEAKLKSTRGANSPAVSLFLSGDAAETARSATRQEDASAVVVLSYDVFNGGRRRAETQRAAELHRKARYDLESAHVDAQARLYNAIDDLRTSDERIIQLTVYESSMRAVVNAYQQQFELGQRPLINLLDVENELLSAKSSVEEERLNRIQAAYRLLAATGGLIEAIQ